MSIPWLGDALKAQLKSAEEERGRLVEFCKGMMSVLDRAFKGEL